MLMELVTRSGGGECDEDDECDSGDDAEEEEDVEMLPDVDFFLRFFLPSPLPMNRQFAVCICRLQRWLCIGMVECANESRKQGIAKSIVMIKQSIVGLIFIMSVSKRSRSVSLSNCVRLSHHILLLFFPALCSLTAAGFALTDSLFS